MSTHTPGPWTAHVRTVTAPETEDDLELRVQINGGNVKVNRANARLIAAAPDLLEQLSRLLAMCERQEDFNDDGDGCMFERARAAVAKATGGAA